MNNNDKIKEAFEKWVDTKPTMREHDFRNNYIDTEFDPDISLGFIGGYTSRDEEVEQLKKDLKFASDLLNQLELKHYATRYNSDKSTVEQLKKDKQELLSMVMELRNDSEELLREYQTSRLREVVLSEQEKRVKNADSLIERMKGF